LDKYLENTILTFKELSANICPAFGVGEGDCESVLAMYVFQIVAEMR
jgi:hypothetical protein